VARLRGIPAVTFFHSHLPQLVASRCGPATGRLAARYLRSLYERFDMVFAPSRITCAYLRSLGLRRVMQQPLGVDTDIFHPRCRDRGLRRELGLARDTRLLVYAGRFSAEKNIAPLQAAFARLGSGYHLLMVGGGESRRTGNITVLPYRRDSAALARLLASADALVHAGTAETFGLIVLEAMACGRPIVAVRAGAVAELVDDEVGIAADRATGDCLAAAVRELYERDLPALRRAARQRIESRFSWHATMLEQLAAYRSLRPASAGQPNPVVALPPAESRSKVPGLDITPAP
jgi:alpha-1,6-mannosyltransferase